MEVKAIISYTTDSKELTFKSQRLLSYENNVGSSIHYVQKKLKTPLCLKLVFS